MNNSNPELITCFQLSEHVGVVRNIANQLPAKYRTDLEHPNLELMSLVDRNLPKSSISTKAPLTSDWLLLSPSQFSYMTFYKHLESIIDRVAETDIILKRFLVFGKQTYTSSEAAAIVSKTFRSITHQENTWTTRNKDITQIYTG